MKKIKKFLWGTVIIMIALAGYGFYLYNKKPADIRKLDAAYALSAADLITDFNKNETVANSKYLDKVISVKGNVQDLKIDPSGQFTVFLDGGDPMSAVTCSFYEEEAGSSGGIKIGTPLTIKGKCTGKLMDVVLNKCSIIK